MADTSNDVCRIMPYQVHVTLSIFSECRQRFATGGIAAFFYWLATRGLLAETRKLRHLTNLILLALQNSGMADLRFDKDGKTIGLNVSIQTQTGGIRFSDRATLRDSGSDAAD